MRREGEIQAAILVYLRTQRIPAWRMNSRVFMVPGVGGRMRPMRAGVKGGADIIGVLPPSGRLLAVEVKSAKGRVTPEQAEFLRVIREAGGVAFVARGLDDVARALDARREGEKDGTA